MLNKSLRNPRNSAKLAKEQKAAPSACTIWSNLRGLLVANPIIIISTIFFGSISVLVSLLDSNGRKQAWLAKTWAKSILIGSGLHVRVEGIELIDPNTSYVFAVNHTSYMDTPVVLANLKSQFRFLAKSSLFRIPLLGWHLTRAGHISVSLGDPRASLKSMLRAAEVVKERNVSLLIFPEGGRTRDGALQSFKEGAAYIAIRAGVPIVPMVLIGAREALPFGTAVVLSAEATLRILKPIETKQYTLKDRGRVTDHLRDIISEHLDRKTA